jgi:hypothetical protein
MSEALKTESITSHLPKAWEQELTFNDILYEWLGRAPWLGISAIAHLMFFLIMAVIPWHILSDKPQKIIITSVVPPEEQITEEPLVEMPEPITEPVEDPTEEPVLMDAKVADNSETVSEDSAQGDPDFINESPFTHMAANSIIGVGAGGGGKLGGRFGDGKGRGRKGGGTTNLAIENGLKWLADHQDKDGKWDADGFMKHDPVTDVCDGAGRSDHDVGVTGLALLAFLGNGNTTRQGPYKSQVVRGIQWLREQQDFETGLIGDNYSTSFLYDHSIAALALCEAYYFSKSPILANSAQKAINFIGQARNPYGVWRYAAPPQGDNDTSVTGWMIFALKSAEEGGLKVDSAAFSDAITWLDEVTDVQNGRVGYSSMGEQSSREVGVNDMYPRELTEAMTAVGLLCRFFLNQDPKEETVMVQHANLLAKTLPKWDGQDGLSNDLYYWYYGSYAMYQMGGKHWRAWNKAMKPAVVDSQETLGSVKGSWEPNGPWGMIGGRVYSTALSVLCMEVYFRYAKVLGGR